MKSYIDNTAQVHESAVLGEGTVVWRNVQIRENALIGKNCNIGKDVYIDHDVKIGDNCKIQNQALLYYDLEIENNVFIGPQVCFTNDKLPRAVNPEGKPKSTKDWSVASTRVGEGASIGAGCIILPGITIGKWSMIGAGSVVTKDVSDYALVFGNPAKPKGYVCICGVKLTEKEGEKYKCTSCKREIRIDQ